MPARGGVDPIVRYAVLGGLGWFAWNWAKSQPMTSPARQTVDQVRATVSGMGGNLTAIASGAAPPNLPTRTSGGAAIPQPSEPPAGEPVEGGEAWTHLGLTDTGGFPLEMRPNRLRQRVDLGGTNEYKPGDVVISANDGRQWQWLGGLALEATDGTGEVTRLDYYSTAIGSP
jgi:hypothetical protein